jgi:N-acetylglucosamine kinase-like BadF-type ATPase
MESHTAPSSRGTSMNLRILAIDGGQAAIRARHSSDASAAAVDGVSRTSGSDDRVAAAVVAVWRSLGSPEVDRAVLGLTTAPMDRREAMMLGRRVGSAIAAREVWVCDDSVTSHAGALSLGAGVSLIAGTGVACLAVPPSGPPRMVGGHGYLLGDEGGGFWIGREGLRAALRAREGRGPETGLTSLAQARFGDLAGVPVRVHDDVRAVNAVAQFATDVLGAAASDAVAESIVGAAADELAGVVTAAAATVPGSEDENPDMSGPVEVALGGRLLIVPTPLRAAVDARLAGDRTLAPRTADHSPLEGAMLMGRQPDPGRYASLVHVWRAEAAS